MDSIVSTILTNIDGILEKFDYVLVQGDTTSVMSIALSSFHKGVKVIHLEAGLRTYNLNNPYPEEMNRQVVSKLTDIHLCPTVGNMHNLERENQTGKKYVVGNTVLDNLADLQTSYNNEVIVTLHRRENHKKLQGYFEAIETLAKQNPNLRFILPLHPNPQVYKYKPMFEHVQVVDPIPYSQMRHTLAKCRMIITDSGGLQEEGSFLNKLVFVCRNTTERPESLRSNSWLCPTTESLVGRFNQLKDKYEINYACPFGDGHSGERIVKILKEVLNG